MFSGVKAKSLVVIALSSIFLAFGVCNIHAVSSVTEGGTLGASLLLDRWLGISPAISSLILDLICFAIGFKHIGKGFIVYTITSCVSYSGAYAVFEQYPQLWPQIANYPLLAAILGAIFIGVGAGVCVRMGGAPGGDDALAMVISKRTGMNIQWAYLISDISILGLSLTYIPLNMMIYSLITVLISGQVIGLVQNIGKKRIVKDKKATETLVVPFANAKLALHNQVTFKLKILPQEQYFTAA
ncbi:MAG: YitT family protein [Christensenellaceae bacterium]|nr:YitT family protein [Christensenellaceae bacterium]